MGSFVVDGPLVLGHEAAGTDRRRRGDGGARASGSGSPSNRSAPTPTAPRPGAASTTCARTWSSTPPRRSTGLCDYVTIGAAFAHPMPDAISEDAAALCEPLSVAIAAVRKAGVTAGSRVLIAGAGPIGIVMAQIALAFGATEVVVIGPRIRSRRRRSNRIRCDRGARSGAEQDVAGLPRGRVRRRVGRPECGAGRNPGGTARGHPWFWWAWARRVMTLPIADHPEPGVGADRGVPLRQHVADGDRAGRVGARRPRFDGDREDFRSRSGAKHWTQTGCRVAVKAVVTVS